MEKKGKLELTWVADVLRSFDDLVICMDEAHRYYAPASKKAINYLNPVLGLEYTATPKSTNKNIIYHYGLEDGAGKFLKIPVVMGRTNTAGYSDDDIEEMKLKDGIKLHERRKSIVYKYCIDNQLEQVKPIVLIACKDTTHARKIKEKIDSDAFFGGRYVGKVIEIDSSTSGAETEENIQKLLTIEKNTNPIEIVLHVYKLKEGWDVNNLFTIIPLNAAKSDILALSHMLIKEMSMQSGYSSSALHERIYSSENMCGILIYTGAADKEGSLGGLVELGGMNKFLPLLKGALENGLTCTTDPECFMKNPTSERLNGAACHSCTMISETACENGNRLLDRALVVPVPEHEEMGYFRELVRDLCGIQV